MNKVFKIIWSNARKCYVVVSEIAKNHGKNNTRSIVSQLAARMEGAMLQMASALHQASAAGGQTVIRPRAAAWWIVPLVLAGILLPSSARATDITRADSNVGVIDVNGGVYDVYVQQMASDKVVGVNQFKKFSLDNGHIANMHFNQKGLSSSVENLVNLVQERIAINGMVNAVKNGKIDGNLYFLSPNGMVVGKTGVINAGKFTALVPGDNYWFKLWDRPDNVSAAAKNDFAKFGTRETKGEKAGQFKASGVELNADTDKNITIQGKINTRSGIVLGAGKIAIENGAVLKSRKDIDFNNLVNATEAGLPSGNLNVTADKSGDIILRAETAYKYENSPLPIGTSFDNGISNISEYVSALTHRNSSAEVTVGGEIAGDGNVDISASSSTTFNNKDWPGLAGVSDIGKEYLNRLGLNIDADVALKYNKASVAIENTGKVSAGGDARVQSDATVTIKMQSKTVGKKDPGTAPGGGNPGQSGTSSALPVVAVAWADLENSALVDVKGDLSAGGDMKLAATTNTTVDLKAQATTEKAPDDPTPGNFAYVSVAVLSGDSVAEVKADEPGQGTRSGKLKAGGDFSAEAAANSEIAVEAIAAGTNDTLAATSFAVLDYDSAANVDLKRSVEGGSITAKADNEVSSLGISADNCAGEGADPFIAWKIKGDTNPGVAANWLKGKIGSGFRQGGSLQSFENAFSSALGYVTAGAAVGFVDNTNTANVTVAPGVELKATGDAVQKDSDGNPVKDEDGKPVAGGYVTLEADTNMASFSHQVAGELNKQGTDAGQDSTVNVAAAALFSNIDNDATVELQSKGGKGATLTSAKGDISLQAKVDSDDENTLSTLRINDVSDVLDKFVEDLGKFGQDFSKFTKWKTEAAEIEKQQADGSISREEAGCRWYNAVAGIYDAIATLPKDYLRQSADAKKIITALNDLVSPASYTNYYVRSYAIDGQDSHGANYDIAGSFNIASQENKGIVAIGENAALTAGKNISLKAEGETEVISGTGNAGEWMAFSETNGTGAGVSVAWQDISADGLILVGKNVNLKAGSDTDRAEGDISLHAGAEVFELGIIYSAGKADRSEWNGTFSLQNGGGNSLVLVDDEAVLDSAGKVSLTALNDITVNNIAGSLALGSSKSKFTVGAGVAVNWLETNSMAVIGDNGTGASAQTTETDTEEFAKKSTEEQNKIIAANTLAAARKLASDRGSVRKMDREFKDSETKVKDLLGKATAGTARGSVTATDIDVRAQNDGTVNAVAVEGVSNSENHAGFDLINKVEKYGAQAKNDIFSFAQGVIGTPETLLNKTASKLSGKDWGWGGKSMFAERKQAFNPIPENNDPADNGFNAALAGSLTLNRNKAGTAAVVNNANLTLSKEDGGKGGALVTAATDDIFTGAWSGAAAINWFTGGTGVASNNAAHKGSLGAAVALNSLNHNVNAQVSNAVITGAGLVDSSAIRNGAEAAAALGLAVTNDSQGTGNNGAVTFGLSVNKSTSGVHALLLDDTLTGGADSNSDSENGTDISIRTYDGDIQVAGGVDFSFANSADAGRAIAAGITAAASEIKNDMRSGIQGGSYTGVGNLTVAGEDALTQVNAAIGIGVTTSAHGFDAAGTLAVAELTNTNRAFISGTDTIKATGDVSVTGREISGTKDNPYKEYLEKRNEDASGSSYLSEEAKQKLGADAGSAFVNVAVDIAGSKAVAGGAGVAVGNLTSRFIADIAGNKKLEADSVKAAVHADTNVVTVAAGFSLSTEKWGGAGSFAFNDLVQEAVASVTGNRDGSDDSSGIKANAVSVTAKNDSDLLSITGDFAGAKGSALGLGLAYNFLGNTTGVYVGNNVINAMDTARGVDVSLDANNNAYELALSLGAAVNNAEDNNFAAEGNFAVNRGHNDTIAVIGEDKDGKKGTYKDKISNASSVTVKATDATQRTTIAGDVDVAWKGSKVALGIGVAMTESERDSKNNDTTANKERLRAEINNADITTVKKNGQGASISAEAKDTSRATTVAAGVGITKQSYLGAQGIGADANILKTNTAGLHDTTVDKNDTKKGALVNVKATTASTIRTGAAALQVSGENTYVTGVLAVGVNRIKDDTAAEVTYTDKQGARSMNVGNLDISAASQADILSVAAGASGTWKGSAAIGGSGSHNYIADNVAAKINNANVSSTGNAGVVARSDEAISNYAGVLDVALQGSTLSAAIGVTGSHNEISGTTEALIKNSTVAAKGSENNKIRANDGLKDDDTYLIDGSVTRNTWSAGSFTEGEGDNKKNGVSHLQKGRKEADKSGVVVDASATHSISSVMANGGVAVNMGGGGGGSSIAGSVAGVVNLNEVGGATTARILDSKINSADRRSDVSVHAADYTNVAEFSGAASVGVGNTAGVAAGFTGTTNEIDRVTAAGISTSSATWNDTKKQYEIADTSKTKNTVYANDFAVTADAKQAMSAFNVTGAVAGSSSVSFETGDNVNTNRMQSSTVATVTNATVDFTKDAKVEASHEDRIYNLNVDAGVAISPSPDSVAGSLNVGIGVVNEDSTVTANVENSAIKAHEKAETDPAKSKLSVSAANSAKLEAQLVSVGVAAGLFSGGIASSIAVNNIDSKVTSRIAGSELAADTINVNTTNALKVKDATGTGAGGLEAGIGVGVDVNTFNDTVSTVVDNSTVKAKDTLAVNTKTQREIESTVAGVGIGAAGIAVNVVAVTVNDGINSLGRSKDEDGNDTSFSHTDTINAVLNTVNDNIKRDLSENFYGMTDAEKAEMKEKIKANARSGDNVSGTGVHTYVQNDSTLEATNGALSVKNTELNDADLNGGSGSLGVAAVNVADTVYHLNQLNDISVKDSTVKGGSVSLTAHQGNVTDNKEDAIRVRTVQAGLGIAGIGVGYAGLTTKGNTGITVDHGVLTATNGDLTVKSTDAAQSKTNMTGVSAAGVAVPVSVAHNTNIANNFVTVKGGSTLTAATNKTREVTDSEGKKKTEKVPAYINLQTDRSGRVAGKTVGVGAGGAAVVVNTAKVYDKSTSAVSVSESNNSFTADAIRLEAVNAPVIKAEAGGTGVALLGVSVMQSNAEAYSTAKVDVADNNKLLGDAVLAQAVIGKEGTDMTHAETHATSGTIVSINPNKAKAITETTASVSMGNETYKTKEEGEGKDKTTAAETGLALIALNNASRRSIIGNTTIGLGVSIGAGDAKAEGNDKSLVTAKGGSGSGSVKLQNLKIDAGGSNTAKGFADGDSGGLFAVGASATITMNTKTTNTASLSGSWDVTGSADIAANQQVTSKGSSKTGAGGLASVTWANSDNNVEMDTRTELKEGARLNAGQSYVLAANKVVTGAYDGEHWNNHMSIGGVIQFAPDVTSKQVITTKANVDVGKNARVTTGKGQVYDAYTDLDITNKVEGKSGGVAENMWIYSDNTTTVTDKITVGEGAALSQAGGFEDGDLTLSSSDKIKMDLASEAYTGGLEGILVSKVENTVTRNNGVEVNGKLNSTHDINLYAGADVDGADAELNITGLSEAHNNTVLSFYTNPELQLDLKNNQQVKVGSAGSGTAVRNINITADNGRETFKKDVVKVVNLFASADKETKTVTNAPGVSDIGENSNNFVSVDGSLMTGIHNKVNITISGSAVPEAGGIKPVSGQSGLVIDTEGSGENFNKDEIRTGDMDYATQLGTRLAAVEALIKEYSTGTDAKSMASYLGYVQQRQRILDELDKRGLFDLEKGTDGKTVKVYKISGLTVRYVEIPEVTASGGNITIQSENLYGKGRLEANGAPRVTVINNSNAYLKLDGIQIKDPGGEIRFSGTGAAPTSVAKNEDVTKLNKDKAKQAAFSTFRNDTAGGLASAIIITNENKAGASVAVKDSTGKKGTYTPITDVAVLGDLSNDSGDIRISNSSGSITIGGTSKGANITGRTVQLTARDTISQDYVDGIVNIGGRPQDLNADEVQKAVAGASSGTLSDKTKDKTASQTGLKQTAADITDAELGRIAGDSVYIAAADINVNGLIQSGYSKYEASFISDKDWIDAVTPDRAVTVQGRTMYKVNDGGRPVYDSSIGAFKYIVQVYYDPQTRSLIVEDIDTKGGRVYLTGRISSTGNGRIMAADGGADITVTNASQLPLTVGKVLNNNIEGKITITDLAKDTWTEYTRFATKTIANYSKYAKDSAAAEKAMKTAAGIGYNSGATPSGAYKVKEGLRYNWTLGTETGTTKYYHRIQNSLFWGALDTSSSEAKLKELESSTAAKEVNNGGSRNLGSGTFIDAINDADYGRTLNSTEFGAIYENRVTSATRTVTGDWKEGGNWWALWSNPTYHLEWNTKTGSSQSYTFSLKADRDIGIGFIGKEDGSITLQNINRNSDGINLTDTVKNNSAAAALTIQTVKGSIVQQGDTALITGKADLQASKNIENIHITSLGTRTASADGKTYTASDKVLLSAVSTNGGNVDITVRGGTADGQALPGNVEIRQLQSNGSAGTGIGDVTLQAEGNITQAGTDAAVKGREITLTSVNGGIGTEKQAIVMDSNPEAYGMNPESSNVDAAARKDIYLTEATGDMRIGSIVSGEGNVTLTAKDGRLLDALPRTESVNNVDEDDLVRHWIDAGLIAGTFEYEGAYIGGLKQDAANYKARVEEQYALFTGGEANAAVQEMFTKADGTAYGSVDEYLKADKKYQAIVDKYTNPAYAWTKDQLLYAIRNAIVNKESGVSPETQAKAANVQGNNVTLDAKGIGMNSDTKTTIYASDLTGSSDKAIANLKKLANADAADVTLKDKNGNILTFGTDAQGKQTVTARDANGNKVETDGLIYSFVIGNLDPLGVKATGQVNVTADGENVFIAGRSDSKGRFSPMNTGVINADGQNVRLYTQEGIYNTLEDGDASKANIIAKNLIAYGGTKDIGAPDKYLGVALSGDLLTANADGSIYIKNMLQTEANGVLRAGSLYAGDTIALDSPAGIRMTRDKNYADAYLNAGNKVQLTADPGYGVLGDASAPLRILNNGAEISLEANEAHIRGVNGLQGDNSTMNVGNVKTTRNATLQSEGNLKLTGNLTAGSDTVLATMAGGSVSVSGSIEANNALLRVDPDKAGNGKGDIVVEGNITARNLAVMENYTKEGNILITGNVTGGDLYITGKNGSILADGKLEASEKSISITSETGNIDISGDLDAKQDLTVKTGGNGTILLYKDEKVDEEMNIHAGRNISLETENNDILVAGKIISDTGDITAATGQGDIIFVGDVKAGGNVNGTVKDGGSIIYSGTTRAGGDVKATTPDGMIIYDGKVEAGGNVTAEAGNGWIWYDGDVRAGGNVEATVGNGIILYADSVSAGGNVEAKITVDGLILYLGKVHAGRNVIADAAAGDILYGNDVEAGRSIISHTGSGIIAYMGKVTAGKDLPEQIRNGYGKIAYYDRYGLVGYSNSFDVTPVRNAQPGEIKVGQTGE